MSPFFTSRRDTQLSTLTPLYGSLQEKPPLPRHGLRASRSSYMTDEVSIAESAMPPPLNVRPSDQALRTPKLPPRHPGRATPWAKHPQQPYQPGSASSASRTQLVSDEGNHFNEPRPPPRTFASSVKRFSLTPSEMPYPMGLLDNADLDDNHKVEQILGLRRHRQPPPLPPKTPSVRTSHSTNSSLLLHKSEYSGVRPVEPQNGRTAWLHALAALLVVFNCWGMTNAFALFQAYYQIYYIHPAPSPSSISWIGSTQLALVFGLGVPVGRLVDKGYFRLMFHSGSVMMVVGLLCTSWCKDLWSLWLVQGLITGMGMGMVFCSGIVALMTWFDEKKMGIAMGLPAAGSCIGGIVYVLLARHFLATKGFPTTMRILAGVAAVTMIPPNIVFRMRIQTHRLTQTRSNLTWRAFTAPSYLLAAAGMFFSFLGVYFGIVYIVSYGATVLKLSTTASTDLFIYMMVTNLPGRFLPALISDKCIGPLNTIIPGTFLSAAVIGLWIATDSEHSRGALTVIACFYGFVSAGIQVLYASTVYTFCLEPAVTTTANTSTTISTQLATDRMGVKAGGIFTCVGVACLIGTPIGGALISYRTDRGMAQPYLGAQVFAACALVLGGCLLLASRVAKIGWTPQRA